jgi:all-trans-retinol 13,14-reductase
VLLCKWWTRDYSILDNIDPKNPELKKRVTNYMKVCNRINEGFTTLGLSRILPSWLHFCLTKRIHSLHKFASMTVRDVQYAVLNLSYYTPERLLEGKCPQAPPAPELDPTIRRLKAVLTHPVRDYAVQPRYGAVHTVGPTQNISIRLSSMVREFGGEVLVSATILDIIVEHGHAIGVRVCSISALEQCKTDEERAAIPTKDIRAKNIVWASGIYNLYSKVVPQDLPQVKDFQDRSKRTVSQSNGHIFKGSPEALNLPKHTLWYFNGYDMDQVFDEYFDNLKDTRPPTCYIGFPCSKNVTWEKRFPGVSNCILISDGLWEWFEKWQNPSSQIGHGHFPADPETGYASTYQADGTQVYQRRLGVELKTNRVNVDFVE